MSANHRFRKAFFAFLLVHFLLKTALLLQYFWGDPFASFQRSDSAVYLEWALRILAGQDYGGRSYYQAPGYPALLSAVWFLAGPGIERVLLLQLAAGSVTLLFIYLIGERLVSSSVGFLGAVLTGLHAPVPFHELKLLSTSWVLLGDAIVFWLALRALKKPEWLRFLLLGLALGLLIVLSPTRLLLAFAGAAGFLLLFRRVTVVNRLFLSAVFLSGLLVAVFPVSLRNRIAEGRWVLVSANSPETFYQGNNRLARGGLTTPEELGTDINSQARNRKAAAERELGRRLTPREIDTFWIGKSLSWVREDPSGFLRLMTAKVLMSFSSLDWFDIYSYRGERQAFLPLLSVFAVPFAFLAFPGLAGFLLDSRVRTAWMGFVFMFAANHAVLLIFYTSTRYRLPSVPWLSLMSAVVLFEVLRPGRERTRTTLVAGIIGGLMAGQAFWDWSQKKTFPEEQFFLMAADAYIVEKRYGEASGWLEKARVLAPSRAVDSKLARVAFLAGHSVRAEELLLGIARKTRLNLDELELWAAVQWNLGRFAPAEQALLTLIETRPANPFLLKRLAACQLELGKKQEARETLARILAANPGDAEATAMAKTLSSGE